jgi:type II secretory pathway pseudopilin PulG
MSLQARMIPRLIDSLQHKQRSIMAYRVLKKFVSGFTLLETAIAVCIFVAIVTSSLYSLHRGLSIIQTAKNINTASSDLEAVCEYLRREVDAGNEIVSQTYTLASINDTQTVSISAENYYDPVPVNITIAWEDDSQRQRTVSVDMLISERQGF